MKVISRLLKSTLFIIFFVFFSASQTGINCNQFVNLYFAGFADIQQRSDWTKKRRRKSLKTFFSLLLGEHSSNNFLGPRELGTLTSRTPAD